MATDLGMESTDKEAIRKYYGEDREESGPESESENSEDENSPDRILDVQNIADSIVFISFSLSFHLFSSFHALKQPIYVGVNSILIEPLRCPVLNVCL